MSTPEKDSFRMSLIRKRGNSPELEKEIFKSNFGRAEIECEQSKQEQRHDQKNREAFVRAKRRQVLVGDGADGKFKVNDIVSIKEFMSSTKRTGIICRIDEIGAGKKTKKWFYVLTVLENRYEIVKVPEKQVLKVKPTAEDKATLSYGAVLYNHDK